MESKMQLLFVINSIFSRFLVAKAHLIYSCREGIHWHPKTFMFIGIGLHDSVPNMCYRFDEA